MDLSQRDFKYIWHPCSQMKDYETLPPIPIEKGEGVYLYGMDGKKYLDIISSWWCNLLGHCHPVIGQEIKKQLDQLEHVIFANFTHRGAVELCESLVQILPKGLSKFNFSDNGSSSVECALKMAFQYQYQKGNVKKTKFMCLSEGYHGETVGALSVGALDLYAKIYQPMLMETLQIPSPDCYRCPYDQRREDCDCACIQGAERIFREKGEDTCALILEPLLQGSAGMKMYPPLYLQKIRALCDEYRVLLIADEIATGFGRTGEMFACDYGNVTPDIMCLSKGLTGGYLPMALTVTTTEVYEAFYDDYEKGKAFMHSHTYSGNPLGCAAALAVQKVMQEENILESAKEKAPYLQNLLEEQFKSHPHVGEIRSLGLINAIELVEDPKSKRAFDSSKRVGYQIYLKALNHGLILRPLGNVLYFNPPLTITPQEMKQGVDLCKKSLEEVL